MTERTPLSRRKKTIIIIAVIVSFVLYLAGVYSGLYANRLIKQNTESDIFNLRQQTNSSILNLTQETGKELSAMQDYISYLEFNLKNVQLQQAFLETLSGEQRCNFSLYSLNGLFGELNYYWDRLPYRLEQYEHNRTLSPDYIQLKQQYTQVSIRTWILAKSLQQHCKNNIVQGLYFYSQNCTDCVAQGEQLDQFRKLTEESHKQLLLFTIDINSDDLIVQYLKEYYHINQTPAILLNDQLMQGKVFTAQDLFKDINGTNSTS